MSKEIVTVGGGTGSPELNSALLLTNKVNFINAIAAVFDSGGATGRKRLNSEGREQAFSDAMRILLSLVSGETQQDRLRQAVIKKWFSHRDSRDEVLGHSVFSHFFDQERGYKQIEQDLKDMGFNLKGTVIPSTTHSSHILFTTNSGRRYTGEHEFDRRYMSKDMVQQMALDPSVPAYDVAKEVLTNAQVIFLSFGSLHGSVLCNFLPGGMTEAIKESKAKIVVVSNLVSTRNETHEFSAIDYLNLIQKYIEIRVHSLVVPEISRSEFEQMHPDVAAMYDLEHSHFLGWSDSQIRDVEKEGVLVIKHNATRIVDIIDGRGKIVRHDKHELAKTLSEIVE